MGLRINTWARVKVYDIWMCTIGDVPLRPGTRVRSRPERALQRGVSGGGAELTVIDAVDEGCPLGAGEAQNRSGSVLAVAQEPPPIGGIRDLDAIAAGATCPGLAPDNLSHDNPSVGARVVRAYTCYTHNILR